MHPCDLNLEDLLADPLVRLVMASDGVDEAQIRTLAQRVAPHQAPFKTPQDRWAGSALRHSPSCRGDRREATSAQLSA